MFHQAQELNLYKSDVFKQCPFARLTLAAMNAADPSMTGTLKPKPYIGVQFMTIPEFKL